MLHPQLSRLLTIMSVSLLILSACSPVNSSELRSTQAQDLTLYATIYEYSTEDDVEIAAAMHTDSGAVIDFDGGQTISAFADAGPGFSNERFLSSGGFLNLDHSYDGTIDKTIADGYYYITYTDAEGDETTASVQSQEAVELTNLDDGDTITTDEYVVTWNPIAITGSLTITATYSSGGIAGIHTQTVSNTGSFTLDLDGFVGSGEIRLEHATSNGFAAGFDEVKLTMRNISKREVNYAIATSNAATLSRFVASTDLKASCKQICEQGETKKIFIDDLGFDCCL